MKISRISVLGALALAACGPRAASPAATPATAETADVHRDQHVEEAPDDPHAGHAAVDDAPAADPTPPPTAPDPAQRKADLLAAETTAFTAARPVLEKYCGSCHEQGGKKASAKKLAHFDLTAYPIRGHHAGEAGATVREVLGVGGGKATMPYGNAGVVKGDELALIVAWTEAFDASHAGGAHVGRPDHDHGH
jgi:hypothetical protein